MVSTAFNGLELISFIQQLGCLCLWLSFFDIKFDQTFTTREVPREGERGEWDTFYSEQNSLEILNVFGNILNIPQSQSQPQTNKILPR